MSSMSSAQVADDGFNWRSMSAHCGVDDETEPVRDADSKLALWKEKFCCIVSNDSDGWGSGEAAKGGADPQGANFVDVIRVFVQG